MPKRLRKTRKRRLRRCRSTRRKQRGGAGSAVVFVLTPNAGFFSTFFFLCKSYIYAKEKGLPFFLEHQNWQYTADKGWHDYFTSCEVYDPSKGYSSVEKFQHGQVMGIPEYTVGQYADVCQELFKPKPELVQSAKNFQASIGGPYTSLYVRRGDKVSGRSKEMELLEIPDILNSTGVPDDGRKIFVQTDDYTVVENVKSARSSCTIYSLTRPEERGAEHSAILAMNPEKIRKHMDDLITSILVFLGGSPAWTDGRSNLGRFHKIFALDTVQVYPSKVKMIRSDTIRPANEVF